MLCPVRCWTCGKVVADLWEPFVKAVDEGIKEVDIMDTLGLKRYCCRRMLLTNVDLIDKMLLYVPNAGRESREEILQVASMRETGKAAPTTLAKEEQEKAEAKVLAEKEKKQQERAAKAKIAKKKKAELAAIAKELREELEENNDGDTDGHTASSITAGTSDVAETEDAGTQSSPTRRKKPVRGTRGLTRRKKQTADADYDSS